MYILLINSYIMQKSQSIGDSVLDIIAKVLLGIPTLAHLLWCSPLKLLC